MALMEVCGRQPGLAVELEHFGRQSICVKQVCELVDELFWSNDGCQAVNLCSKAEWHLKEEHLLQKRRLASCDDG
jgi:hypothetical protein